MFNSICNIFCGVYNFVSGCIRTMNTICPGFGTVCANLASNYVLGRMGWAI